MIRALRLGLVLVVLLTAQTTWMADWAPFGSPPDLLLLLAIAGGMSGGPQRGAVVGFVAGIGLDLMVLTPFGLSALAYLGVGFVVGFVHDSIIRSAPWIPVVVTVLASVAGVGLYVILGQLLGQQFRLPELARVMAVTSLLNGVLALPTLWVTRWVERAAPDTLLGASGRAGVLR